MLGPILLLNINRKTIYGQSNDTITFDLELPWKVKLIKVTRILKDYIS